MLLSNNYKSLKKLISKFLLLCLVLGAIFFPMFPSYAAASSEAGKDYVIRLTSPKYFGDLASVAFNIHHLFLGNQNPQFQNIYSFSSAYALPALEQGLSGEFFYLETSKL